MADDGPRTFLSRLAPSAVAGWLTLGARTLPGDHDLTTVHSVYRVTNGVFGGRARKEASLFTRPEAMRGTLLVGFLFDDEGQWALSPRWLDGAHAAFWRPGSLDERAFVVTSPTVDLAFVPPPWLEPAPSPWAARRPPSGAMRRRSARPPSIRTDSASVTRLHSAEPASSGR
jgi:hypothetical protein